MKKVSVVVAIILFYQIVLISHLKSQNIKQVTNNNLSVKNHYAIRTKTLSGDTASSFFFTTKHKPVDKAWKDKNKGYCQNQDTDFVDKYLPSDKAIELFEKRTQDSKQYVDKDSTSKYYIVKSTSAIHYKKDGQWLTIDERLEPQGNNLFEARRQEEPVGFDTNKRTAYIKSLQGTVYFNNWMLYGQVNGRDTLLAMPNWSDYKAGDEGIYITNIFPGINAEMKVGRGTIKTSFIVRKNNFYGVGKLIFKDIFKSEKESKFTYAGSSESNEADYVVNGGKAIHISKAITYQENDASNTTIELAYSISKDTVSLAIDTLYLNKHLANGNIVIDPLVSTTNTIAQTNITGSMDCGDDYNSCNYILQVPSLPKTTITGIYFKFGFQTVGTALLRDGYWNILTDTCGVYCSADPSDPTSYNSHGTVSTLGEFSDITSFLLDCMPAPSCSSQNIPFTLQFFNDICTGTTVCSNNNIEAEEPFVIMIEGHTLEPDSVSSALSVCLGQTATLIATGKYGVPPYTSLWNNGVGSGNSVTVSPASNTTYQVTIIDQCSNAVTKNVLVTVKSPTTGAVMASICQGENYTIGGTAYNTPGTYTAHLANAAGCDSTVTLHLSVLQSKQTSITEEICSGEVYSFGNSQLSKAGNYTNHLLTTLGCDSAVILTLKVKPSYTISKTVNLLYGDTYTINGYTYNNDGIYTDVFTAEDGCDSTIITTVAIERSLCPAIVVPEFFSPNGDGENDFLEIENIMCYIKSKIYIYDRFGKCVAHYVGTDQGWDGNYLGHSEPSGDYWYLIELPETGKKEVGHFTLKR